MNSRQTLIVAACVILPGGMLIVDNARIRIDVDGTPIGGLYDGFRLRVGDELVPDPDCFIHGHYPDCDARPPNRQITGDADDATLPGQRRLCRRGIARPSQKRERGGDDP